MSEMQDDTNQHSTSAAYLLTAAKELRACQRAYMADRGNASKGQKVGKAAENLDRAIAAAEPHISPLR